MPEHRCRHGLSEWMDGLMNEESLIGTTPSSEGLRTRRANHANHVDEARLPSDQVLEYAQPPQSGRPIGCRGARRRERLATIQALLAMLGVNACTLSQRRCWVRLGWCRHDASGSPAVPGP